MARQALQLVSAALLASLAAAGGYANEYALYDFQGTPGADWTLMSVDDFATHREEFINFYNEKGGLAPVKKFHPDTQ